MKTSMYQVFSIIISSNPGANGFEMSKSLANNPDDLVLLAEQVPVSMKSVLDKYADETTKTVNRASVFTLNLMEGDESSALNRGQIEPPF